VEASPYFAQKVLIAVREGERRSFGLATLLRWFIPAASCAALVVAWTAYRYDQQETFNAYFDKAAELETLIASDDSSLWLDDATL
jgi:hypothetical protein